MGSVVRSSNQRSQSKSEFLRQMNDSFLVIIHIMTIVYLGHRVTIPNVRQWGYNKGLSTELLLVYLTDKWKMEMGRGKFVGIILIDFRKAFDTVDHSIMQLKLQGAGLANGVAEWINDYLSDRQQFTEINGEKSELQGITRGVPQGSLLGPRLFSIYVEDFPSCTSQGEIELYVDDTTAYCTGNSIDEVHVSLEKMLKIYKVGAPETN